MIFADTEYMPKHTCMDISLKEQLAVAEKKS